MNANWNITNNGKTVHGHQAEDWLQYGLNQLQFSITQYYRDVCALYSLKIRTMMDHRALGHATPDPAGLHRSYMAPAQPLLSSKALRVSAAYFPALGFWSHTAENLETLELAID